MENKTELREKCIIEINKQITSYKKTLIKVNTDYLPGEYAYKVSKKEFEITNKVCRLYKLNPLNISKIRDFNYSDARNILIDSIK
ncbi:hypothetical protein RPMD05_49 [Rhodobacteraceae phage LS06-2018-MD05]|nr:hypothetical protein RPMD05_49 [Rhodobacteraceae phage LS06-2018-MD05]